MYIPKHEIHRIKSSILPLNYEVCGYLVVSQSGEITPVQAAVGSPQDVRPHCTLPHNGNYTWHSHFLGAKSYPSPEDILKIMKKRDNPDEQKLVELIFTRWGIWEISSAGKQKFTDVPAELSYLTERVNDIYKWSNGGKTDQYDSKALTAILAQTMRHYNRLGLSIMLTPWSIIKDNYYIIFPIT